MGHDINQLLTVEEVCGILNIGPNAAYRLLNSGELKAFRIGRVWTMLKSVSGQLPTWAFLHNPYQFSGNP